MRLLLILTFISVTSSFGAVAHVQSAAGFCSTTSGGNMASACTTGVAKAFTFTATNTNDATVIAVSCGASSGTVTAIALSATGWTFTQVGGIVGNTTNGFMALFRAYSPNTSAATITQTWTASSGTCHFMNDLVGEFSGADLTNFADGNNSATGSGTPTVSVTPTGNNDGVWSAANDSVTAVGTIGGTTATKGGDDTQGDWSEYRILSGGAGSAQSCTFTGSGTYTIVGIAIKPAAAAAATPHNLTLLGVGD